MPGCDDFSPLGPNQKKTIAWRFAAANSAFLPAGVTLTGAPTITVTDAANIDPNPSDILIGSAAIGTYSTDPASTAVTQQIGNGKAGAVYLFDVVVNQSDNGDIAEAWNHMRCEAPA